jgi:hypothetical protein
MSARPGPCGGYQVTGIPTAIPKSPRLGYQSVSDTWGLAKVVRKVEFKLLHHIRPQEIPYSSQTIPARWMQPAPTS